MMNNTRQCPYCGEEIKLEAKKCKHCEAWLTNSEIKKNVNVVILTIIKWIVFGYIGYQLLCAIFLIIFAIFMGMNSGS